MLTILCVSNVYSTTSFKKYLLLWSRAEKDGIELIVTIIDIFKVSSNNYGIYKMKQENLNQPIQPFSSIKNRIIVMNLK